ncbi:hypothetical protein ANCDUO_03140 [Ancylostoma duodenale]|uniref:Paired domain-containing protein n=1 Tax=Ancylostoma duodenale TaxID=51022 RepID=A0A0C2DUN1_9BILA|nr:hypothetical protein ANCDUO_03140 [Ancylostoma duodenale]
MMSFSKSETSCLGQSREPEESRDIAGYRPLLLLSYGRLAEHMVHYGKANPKRAVIIEMYKRGLPSKKISSLLGSPIRTVQNAIKRFKELGTNADRRGRGRKHTVVVPRMIKTVRELIRRNPRRSMRKMARNLGIGRTSVRKIVRKKLNLRSFRMRTAHFLNDRMKVIRWQRCKELLKRFAGDTHLSIIFKDDKIFTLDPVLNSQSDRILSRTLFEAFLKGKIVARTEHPKTVMVW